MKIEKHGLSKTRTYKIWSGMKRRCLNPKSHKWKQYGGRGIKVCARWLVFSNFLLDMGHPPTTEHTLDRKNTNGHYCKENCQWATDIEQRLNKTTSTFFTLNGVTKNITVWCKEAGLKLTTVQYRLSIGWSFEKAITTPPEPRTVRKTSRSRKPLTIHGVTKLMHEWYKHFRISRRTVQNRLARKWNPIDAIITPPGQSKPSTPTR